MAAKKIYNFMKGAFKTLTKGSGKKGTTRVKKSAPPKTINKSGIRKAPTKADDMARAKQYKSKDISKKAVKPKKTLAKVTTGASLVGGGAYLMSKAGGDKNKKTSKPKNNDPSTKKNFGMGMVDNLSKAKARQGPPKPVAKAPKKKSRSNISNSSSYDANFTAKKLKERGLSPKSSMSAKNYAKTTEAKEKKIAKGMDFGQKKKKVKAPFYEMGGTMGGVKKAKYATMGGKMAKYKAGGGKMKMAKYYSSGGMIFTGR